MYWDRASRALIEHTGTRMEWSSDKLDCFQLTRLVARCPLINSILQEKPDHSSTEVLGHPLDVREGDMNKPPAFIEPALQDDAVEVRVIHTCNLDWCTGCGQHPGSSFSTTSVMRSMRKRP